MDIFGWDTVYLISMDKVNSVIATSTGELPQMFNFTAEGIQIQGTFSPWMIVKGGSEKLLHLKVPIKNGNLIMGQTKEYDLSNVAVVVEISLGFIPSNVSPTKKNLAFNIKTASDPEGSLVTPITVLDPDNHLDDIRKTLLEELLVQYMMNNASQISYIFAEINFAKPDTNSWLTPVLCDYAYIQKEGGSQNGYLAILSVTTQRDISQLLREVDPTIVTNTSNAGIAISKDLFLQNVIQPVLPFSYPGTAPAMFAFNPADHSIHNTRSFATPSVKAGAITYYPSIDNLVISIFKNDILTAISGSCSLKAGINMSYKINLRNAVSYNASSQNITFNNDPHPDSSHDASIPWYLEFLSPIVALIVNIIVPILANSVADTLRERAKMTFTQSPPQSVHWAGSGAAMNVTDAGLDDSFFMQGNV